MTLNVRVDLTVPYSRKEEAKALGARWDGDKRTWYAPSGTDLRHFDHRWLPKNCENDAKTGPSSTISGRDFDTEKGVSLTDLLTQVKTVVEQGLPDAVWVRAEISELRGKNGHLYLTLAERNERGDVLAQCKGAIWKSKATVITQKFVEATGEGLKPDIKILCLARVRFDPLYGLDLIIEDVDPSYTLGDLEAKKARIREWLVKEALYERNKALPAPVEYVRVAVISPETSAGLGDFRRETDRLHHAGLCEFLFFGATFQGLDAPSSLRTAVNEALAAHRHRPFDALVIIRGGGSVTDLAWLNDLELARMVCRAPIPVLTGIGHERDNTILDEIAHRRFDTPSKVALHVSTTIKDNALGAMTTFDQINLQVARILTRERTALATQFDRVGTGVRSVLDQAECDHERFLVVIRTAAHFQLREERTAIETQAERIETGVQSVLRQARDDNQEFMATIRTTAQYQIREANQALEAGYVRLIGTADQTLCEANQGLKQAMQGIAHRTELRLGEQRAAVDQAANAVALQAGAKAEAVARDLESRKAQVGRDATRLVTKAADDLDCDLAVVTEGAEELIEAARRDAEANTRIVIGMGPQATLRRGFTIVRDAEDRPVTSREVALGNIEFVVQFHDGTVPVAVRGSEGGDGR